MWRGVPRFAAILILIGTATATFACGEEDPAPTAQTPQAQDLEHPGAAGPETGAHAGAKAGGDRPDRTRGGENRKPSREADPGGSKGDGRESDAGTAERARGPAATAPAAATPEQLEAAVQELIDGSTSEPPERGDSGLQLPPALLQGGDKPQASLEEICVDPDRCPGGTEGPAEP